MEDYTKYLSYDNKKGLLINREDKEILDLYQINYGKCTNLKSLIIIINEYLSDNYYEDLEKLEIVLEHLSDNYYYNYVKK